MMQIPTPCPSLDRLSIRSACFGKYSLKPAILSIISTTRGRSVYPASAQRAKLPAPLSESTLFRRVTRVLSRLNRLWHFSSSLDNTTPPTYREFSNFFRVILPQSIIYILTWSGEYFLIMPYAMVCSRLVFPVCADPTINILSLESSSSMIPCRCCSGSSYHPMGMEYPGRPASP